MKTFREQTKAPHIISFKSGEQGPTVKIGRKQQKAEEKFQPEKDNHSDGLAQNLVEEQNLEYFSLQITENNIANELILDSCATSHTIKDKGLLQDIDRSILVPSQIISKHH